MKRIQLERYVEKINLDAKNQDENTPSKIPKTPRNKQSGLSKIDENKEHLESPLNLNLHLIKLHRNRSKSIHNINFFSQSRKNILIKKKNDESLSKLKRGSYLPGPDTLYLEKNHGINFFDYLKKIFQILSFFLI